MLSSWSYSLPLPIYDIWVDCYRNGPQGIHALLLSSFIVPGLCARLCVCVRLTLVNGTTANINTSRSLKSGGLSSPTAENPEGTVWTNHTSLRRGGEEQSEPWLAHHRQGAHSRQSSPSWATLTAAAGVSPGETRGNTATLSPAQILLLNDCCFKLLNFEVFRYAASTSLDSLLP